MAIDWMAYHTGDYYENKRCPFCKTISPFYPKDYTWVRIDDGSLALNLSWNMEFSKVFSEEWSNEKHFYQVPGISFLTRAIRFKLYKAVDDEPGYPPEGVEGHILTGDGWHWEPVEPAEILEYAELSSAWQWHYDMDTLARWKQTSPWGYTFDEENPQWKRFYQLPLTNGREIDFIREDCSIVSAK